ncbi:SMP-30/gluconolactonase/LRE family protein [Aliikangiella maris]|uniref:SMP-30/gluconolactonase/LRE family protein n=2 Tax=Aliikangiella maris TaxID=3162458 RepID=A0ABV2BRS6_9GAMM
MKKRYFESDYVASLGESLFLDEKENKLYWLDIEQQKLIRYCFSKQNETIFQLPERASVILDCYEDKLVLATATGLYKFSLLSKNYEQIITSPEKYRSKQYRSNDGTKIDDDWYIYGIMNEKYTPNDGAVILVKNKTLTICYEGISIPNTFILLKDSFSILISDSLEKKIYRFQFNQDWSQVVNKKTWLDFSHFQCTPDGGCINTKGDIFITFWDGNKVVRFSKDGTVLDEYFLAAKRPTSCIYNENEMLFVSSANIKLNSIDLKNYPLSGKVFTVDLKND